MRSRGFAVGIGVNLGDRTGQFDLAIRLLAGTPGIEVLEAATPIRTSPVVSEGEKSRHPWYLNSVVVGSTTLSPRALMGRLLAIETVVGRRRRGGCDPRTLDLDLVIMEGTVIDEVGIRIPHPRLAGRTFVLEPLAEVLDRLESTGEDRVLDIVRGIRSSLPSAVRTAGTGS
ncbi:MAG: 2-amino-4-hydroxy-6-hydroxymethyldihydropteridine diphosphokinase [Phycisphaerae bacterium]|nr:2-amino-4-hydroxy-6-hydroxymethyldihydropteridine diphosphokinase [Phycisphaerae bacterium]